MRNPHLLSYALLTAAVVTSQAGESTRDRAPTVARAAHTSAGRPESRVQDVRLEALHRAEYEFSARRAGVFSAPNRRQGLRILADAAGMSLSPRDPGTSFWSLHLRSSRFGRRSALVPLRPGVP